MDDYSIEDFIKVCCWLFYKGFHYKWCCLTHILFLICLSDTDAVAESSGFDQKAAYIEQQPKVSSTPTQQFYKDKTFSFGKL